MSDLEAKLSGIIAKLDKLPYEAIGADLARALATLDQVLADADKAVKRIDAEVTPELKATLEEAHRVVATANDILKNGVNTTLDKANTTLTQATTTLEELRRPIATADVVLKHTDASVLDKNAPVQQELRDALQEVGRAARSLRVLTDYLERHPEALIRGKTEETP